MLVVLLHDLEQLELFDVSTARSQFTRHMSRGMCLQQKKLGFLNVIVPVLTSLIPMQMRPMDVFAGRDPKGLACACIVDACGHLHVNCSVAEIAAKIAPVEDLEKCVSIIER